MRFVRGWWLWPIAMLWSGYALAAEIPALVGRVAYSSGEVQFYGEEQGQWEEAFQNEPVTSHNSIYTGSNGRTEVRFADTAIGFGPDTQLDIARLDELTFAATVAKGSIVLSKGGLAREESTTISLAGTQFQLLDGGRYRFDVAPDGAGATATVLAGRLTALLGDGPTPIEAGSALVISDGEATVRRAEVTDLDSWLDARLRRQAAPQATRYVSPLMTGYDELDANGRWQTDPNYGTVWYPTTVSSDWVPYRFGHWRWVNPWGWTWIDEQPWGFAPFHYGRWVEIDERWCWVPGRYERRPVYAPALVAFVGGAAGFAVSASVSSGPAVGWYPLAPWERYTPSYTRNATYISQVNNVTIATPPSGAFHEVNNTRMSINQLRGATVVPRAAFLNSHSVATAAVAVAPTILAAQPVSHSGPAVPRPQPSAARAEPATRALETGHGPVVPNAGPARQGFGRSEPEGPARLAPGSSPSARPMPQAPAAIGGYRQDLWNRLPEPPAPPPPTRADVQRENGARLSETPPLPRSTSTPMNRPPVYGPTDHPDAGRAHSAQGYTPPPHPAEPGGTLNDSAARSQADRLSGAPSAPRPEPQRQAPAPTVHGEPQRFSAPAASPSEHLVAPSPARVQDTVPAVVRPQFERPAPPPVRPVEVREVPRPAPPAAPVRPVEVREVARPAPPAAPVRPVEVREAPRPTPPAPPPPVLQPHPAAPVVAPPAAHPAAAAHPEVRRDDHEPH